MKPFSFLFFFSFFLSPLLPPAFRIRSRYFLLEPARADAEDQPAVPVYVFLLFFFFFFPPCRLLLTSAPIMGERGRTPPLPSFSLFSLLSPVKGLF